MKHTAKVWIQLFLFKTPYQCSHSEERGVWDAKQDKTDDKMSLSGFSFQFWW